MESPAAEPIEEYRERLRHYTDADLEDILRNIHSLQEGQRYRLLLEEVERRGIAIREEDRYGPPLDLYDRLNHRPFFRKHTGVRSAILAVSAYAVSAATALALLVPVWALVVPWKFVGAQASIVYLGYLPLPMVVGADYGRRVAGRGRWGIAALLGVVTGLLLFNLTGVPQTVIHSLTERSVPGGSGGSPIMGGF